MKPQNIQNTTSAGTDSGCSLKEYHSPRLTSLGGLRSLIQQQQAGAGPDGGDPPSNLS
jgi:hypothetical protein